MINQYLKQSGYLASMKLSSRNNKMVIALLLGLVNIGLFGLMALSSFWTVPNFLLLVKLLVALDLVLLVAWFFLNFLEREKNLSPQQMQQLVRTGAYGEALDLFAAQLLYRCCQDNFLYLPVMFNVLVRYRKF